MGEMEIEGVRERKYKRRRRGGENEGRRLGNNRLIKWEANQQLNQLLVVLFLLLQLLLVFASLC